jgi:hypothetical protein
LRDAGDRRPGNVGETKLSPRDGLLKLKVFPHGFGGSGIEVVE